jgi:hypothetical protein
VRTAAEEVARLACGLDLITVVAAVRVDMIMNHATGGQEPWAALLELITLVLACRDSSGSELAAGVGLAEFLPRSVEAAASEALAAGSMIALFDTQRPDAEAAIVFYSVQREIALRNAAQLTSDSAGELGWSTYCGVMVSGATELLIGGRSSVAATENRPIIDGRVPDHGLCQACR